MLTRAPTPKVARAPGWMPGPKQSPEPLSSASRARRAGYSPTARCCRILASSGQISMPVRLLRALAVAAVIAHVACAPKAPEVTGLPEVVDFNFHVRPILSDRCFKCHGPDDRVRKGGLRLDTRNGFFTRLASGHTPVVPGSTRRSEMVRRILSTDPAVMMPAPDSHLTLTDTERAVLVRWIEQGAVWKPLWSLI